MRGSNASPLDREGVDGTGISGSDSSGLDRAYLRGCAEDFLKGAFFFKIAFFTGAFLAWAFLAGALFTAASLCATLREFFLFTCVRNGVGYGEGCSEISEDPHRLLCDLPNWRSLRDLLSRLDGLFRQLLGRCGQLLGGRLRSHLNADTKASVVLDEDVENALPGMSTSMSWIRVSQKAVRYRLLGASNAWALQTIVWRCAPHVLTLGSKSFGFTISLSILDPLRNYF